MLEISRKKDTDFFLFAIDQQISISYQIRKNISVRYIIICMGISDLLSKPAFSIL